MEFIEGERILDFLARAEEASIRSVLKEILRQLLILDGLGVNKEEFHWPVKHIIVRPGNGITLLDFERCRKTQRPKNITQFLQFLASNKVNALLEKKGIVLKPALLRQISRTYAESKKLTLSL